MDEMIRMMQMGGPLMYAVLLLALFVPVTALAMGIGSGLRVWLPAVAWLAMPGLVVVAGAAGWILGQTQTLEALGAASVEVKDTLLFAGFGIALIPQWFGLYLACAGLLATAFCASIGTVVGVGRGEVRWTFGGAVGALALAFLAAIGPIVLSFMRGSPTGIVMAVTVLGVGACLAIAGLRIGLDPADRRRGAAMRVQVALYGGLAVAALTVGMILHGRSQAFDAVSHAAPDMLAALMAMSLEQGELAMGGGLIALAGIFIASLPVVVPQLRYAGGLRSAAGAVLALGGIAVVAALCGVGQWQQGRAMSITSMMRALAASDAGGALPTPGREDPAIAPFDRILVHGSGGWERRDESDLPYYMGEFDPVDPLLVIDPGLRARTLVQADWMTGDLTGFHVLTREAGAVVGDHDDLLRTQRLGTADFVRYTGSESESGSSGYGYGYGSGSSSTPALTNSVFVVDGTAHGQAAAWEMGAGAESVWLVGRLTETASLGSAEAAADYLRDTVPTTGAEYAVFVPGDTWSVQDLVDLCHVLGESTVDWQGNRTGVGCGVATDLPAPG